MRVTIRLRLPLGLALCAASASTSFAQSALSSGWHNVQALPNQTLIRIATNDSTQTCFLDSVSEDRIACFSAPSHAGVHYEFTREQIKSIRLSGHFSRTSAVVTAAAFTGAGAAIGATQRRGISNSAKPIGVGAAGGLGVGVLVGILVGHATGGSHGSLVYRRP